jgi:hypothetical protein
MNKRQKQKQKRKAEFDALTQAIKEGATNIEIQKQFGELYLKYHKAIDRVRLNFKRAENDLYFKKKYGGTGD